MKKNKKNIKPVSKSPRLVVPAPRVEKDAKKEASKKACRDKGEVKTK